MDEAFDRGIYQKRAKEKAVLLKLYTIYSPPNHRDGVVHATKKEAESDTEHFDGTTTE